MPNRSAIDPYKVVDYLKEKRPDIVRDMSDYDIFEYSKEVFPAYKENFEGIENPYEIAPRVEGWDELLKSSKQEREVYSIPLTTNKNQEDADYSPESMSFLDKALEFSIAEAYADEGGFGMPPEFYQQAYNESMAGMAYAIKNGKFKYDVGDYKPEVLGEVGQFLLGLGDPLGVASFIGAPGIGSYATKKALTKLAQKGIENGIKRKIATGATTFAVPSPLVINALSQGGGFGAYATAVGAMASATEQATDPNGDGSVDGWKVAKDAVAHGLEGIALGTITGGTGQLIGGKFAKTKWAKSPNVLKQKANKIASKTTEIGVEATQFTALPYVFHEESRPESFEDFKRDLAFNTALITTLKGGMSLFNRSKKDLNDISALAKQKVSGKNPFNKTKESLLNDIEVTPEQRLLISEGLSVQTKKDKSFANSLPQLDKEYARVNQLLSKDKLTQKETIELQDRAMFALEATEGMYVSILEDPSLIGTLVMSPETEAGYQARIKSIQNFKDKLNEKVLEKVEASQKELDKVEPPEVDLSVGKGLSNEEKISELVSQIGAKLKIAPDEIRAQKEYQSGLFDVEGNPLLSLEKLERGYKDILKSEPDTPQSALSKVISEMNVDSIKDLDFINKKIDKKTPIKDYVEDSGLNKENKKMLYQGFSEFMQNRKSSNSPQNYKLVTDYAKWLQEKGKKVTDANAELTELYIKEKQKEGLFRKKSQRNALNNSLSAFYGTGGDNAKILTGFTYSYMGDKGVNVRVSTQEGRKGTVATPEKIGIAPPQEYSKIQEAKKSLVAKGENLQGEGQSISPKAYDTATEMLYEFGSRGQDTFNRLYIENIDWKNGIIKEWSTGEGVKGAIPRSNIPLKEIIPELWNKLVDIKGNRESGVLFKDIDGQNLTGESINAINKQIMPKGVSLRGKKGKLTIQDYRRMATTDASNISPQVLDFVDQYLIGHVPKEMKQVYNIKEIRKLWNEFRTGREGLSRGKDISKEAGDALDRLTEAGTLGGNKNFYKRGDKEYTLRQKLDDALLVASEVMRQGAKSFKEFSKQMVKKLGNTIKAQLSKLYNQAKQYIKDYIEEPKIGLGIKDVTKGMKKPKKSKVDVDKGEFIKADEFAIKEKVSEVENKYKALKERMFPEKDGKISTPDNRTLLRSIADMAIGLENKNFTSFKKLSYEDLNVISNLFDNPIINRMVKRKDWLKWMEKYSNVESIRLNANIGDRKQKQILKDIGVEDGLINKASLEDLNIYYDYIMSSKLPQFERKSWIDEWKAINNYDMKDVKHIDINKLRYTTYPVEVKVERLGFKPLKEKLFDHMSAEMSYLGSFNGMQGNMAMHLSKDKPIPYFERFSEGQRYFNKIKDNFQLLLDNPRRLEQEKLGKLTDEQKDFFSKALDKDGNLKDTPEGRAGKELVKGYAEMQRNFLESISKHMTEAKYDKWKSEHHIKWIKEGSYANRQFTKEFLDEINFDELKLNEMLKRRTEEIAYQKVKKKYANNPNVDEAFLKKKATSKEIMDEARIEALEGYYDSSNYTLPSISSRFLNKRARQKFPEYWTNSEGKEFKVYDDSWNAVERYFIGMSKYIPTVEFLPEYSKIPGFKVRGLKAGLEMLRKHDKSAEQFITKTIEERIGLRKNDYSPLKPIENFASNYAQMLAKSQLAGFMSGIKNGLIGTYQSVGAASEAKDILLGFCNTFSRENQKILNETGLREVGLRHIDNQITLGSDISNILTGKKIRKIDNPINTLFDLQFALGGMRPSENYTRYLSANIAKVELNRISDILQRADGNPSLQKNKEYKNAIIRLENFYRLPKEDIKLFQKYAFTGATFLPETFENVKIKRRLKQISDRLITAAHIYTQGSSLQLFQPEIFNLPVAKHLVLYKRMAYTSTYNTAVNTQTAYKTNSWTPLLILSGVGAGLAGATLMALNEALFGVDVPNESDPFWERISTFLWKGEMLGLISEMFNPDRSLNYLVNTAIGDNSGLIINGIISYARGEVSGKQASDAFLRSTVANYGAARKLYERKVSPYNRGYMKFRKIWKKFEEEINPNKGTVSMNTTEKTPYYKDFVTAFNLGTEDDFAKQYALTYTMLVDDYYNRYRYTGVQDKIALENAEKEAKKILKYKMTILNPNKKTVIDWYQNQYKDLNVTEKAEIDTWFNFMTKEQKKELKSLEAQYAKKYRSFNKNYTKHMKKYLPWAIEKELEFLKFKK